MNLKSDGFYESLLQKAKDHPLFDNSIFIPFDYFGEPLSDFFSKPTYYSDGVFVSLFSNDQIIYPKNGKKS